MLTVLRKTGETLGDELIVAMVLKGLPESFKPFSIHVTQNSNEVTFSEFKTQVKSYEDTEKYRNISNDDNVMKLSYSTSKMTLKAGCCYML